MRHAGSNVRYCKHSEPKAEMCPFSDDSQFSPWLRACRRSSSQECFLLSKRLLRAAVENPLQARLHCPQMSDSSHMRSMGRSVYIPHPHPTPSTTLFDDSEPRQISHVFQQIIVSTSLPRCEESCPVHTRDRKELPESMHPKMCHVG